MRVAIVSDDDGNWYVRRIAWIEHNLDRDEKVYRCDVPIGGRFKTLDEAVAAAQTAIDQCCDHKEHFGTGGVIA